MLSRQLRYETLEARQLLAAQAALDFDFLDVIAETQCHSTTAVEQCGVEDPVASRIEHLWSTTVTSYLADDLWLSDYQYDAGHNLMVPLHAAFQLSNAGWQQQFADQFRRFAASEAAASELSTGYESEISLGRIQYLYLGSRFVSLAHQAGTPELVPAELIATIYQGLERIWQEEPAWQWQREDFAGGLRERLQWKLETTEVSSSFHRAILDYEQYAFAIAADLRAYERATRPAESFSPVITEILQVALQVHQQEIVWNDNGGWLMQPGVWTDHATYAHAGHLEVADEMPELKVAGIAEDSAHAVRWPLWLRSFAEAQQPDSAEAQYYQSLTEGLEIQFFETVLVAPTEDFASYRLTNFMDGHNGIYRWNYPTHPNDGYLPHELSGVLHDGWWGFLDTARVRQIFREVADDMPPVAVQLETFLGPGTSRTRHPVMVGAYSYSNGFLELTSRLAGELSGWKPSLNDLPRRIYNTDSQTLIHPLTAEDPDGDPVVVSAEPETLEFLVRTQLGLQFTGQLHENWGGAGEKWLRGDGNAWYFLLPNGELWEWDGGPTATGELVVPLSPQVYANPEMLYDAQPGESAAQVSVVEGQLQIIAPSGFKGTIPVQVTAQDDHNATSQLVFAEFGSGPQLMPIDAQVISGGESTVEIPIDAFSATPEEATLTARALALEFALDEQLGLRHDGNYELNWGGRQEKWLEGQYGAHYFLTPEGALYRWDRSPSARGELVAELGSEVYETPTLLHEAEETTLPVDFVYANNAAGFTLAITPDETLTETFVVEATWQESTGIDRQMFTVAFEQSAGLGQQSLPASYVMPSSQDRALLQLPQQASASTATVYEIVAQSLEYALDQEHQFDTNGDLYENWGGRGERWVISGEGDWHFITPAGELYRWDGSSNATGELIATFSAAVHANPELLYAAEPDAAPAVVRAWGSLLEIDPLEGYHGSFVVEVTATHKTEVLQHTITVQVNQTPEIGPLRDHALPADAGEVRIDFSVLDPDDNQHTAVATARTQEAALDASLDLQSAGSYYTNWGGTNEKWLLAAGGKWFFIRPDGALYQWDGQAGATGTLIAQLSGEIYTSPSLLHEASDETPRTLSVEGDQIVIDVSQLQAKTYVVTVELSDGVSSSEGQFKLTVG